MKGAAAEYLGDELMRPEARELVVRMIQKAPVSKAQRRSLYGEWQLLTGAQFVKRDLSRVSETNDYDRAQNRR